MHQFYDNIALKYQGENFETIDFTIKVFNMAIYYMLIVYMLYAVFISIMHETYRNIGIEKGDPHAKEEALNIRPIIKQFLMWFFAFLPEKQLKKLG